MLGVLGKMRMTYTIDKHSAVDGGSNCRTILGVAFRAGERVVIALKKIDGLVHHANESRWLSMAGRKMGPAWTWEQGTHAV